MVKLKQISSGREIQRFRTVYREAVSMEDLKVLMPNQEPNTVDCIGTFLR